MRPRPGHARSLALLPLILVSACSTPPGPRDRERTESEPPPRVDDATLERVGKNAGEQMRATVGLLVEPVATDRVISILPSRELPEIDEARLIGGFIEGARIRTRPGATEGAATALVARVSALVRRQEEGSVAVDYLFSFLLRRGTDVPWAWVEVVSVPGPRGTLEPTAIGQESLIDVTEACARDVARMLRERRKAAAALVPAHGVDEKSGVVLGFEDHLRAALLRNGVHLGVGEALPRIQSEISLESTDPVAGSESHRFKVELYESAMDVPWSQWERQRTITGGKP